MIAGEEVTVRSVGGGLMEVIAPGAVVAVARKVKAKGRGKVAGMDGVSVDLTGDEPLETVADLGVGPRTCRLYLISRLSLFPKNEGLSRSLSRSN